MIRSMWRRVKTKARGRPATGFREINLSWKGSKCQNNDTLTCYIFLQQVAASVQHLPSLHAIRQSVCVLPS